jgi:hypothetical protein
MKKFSTLVLLLSLIAARPIAQQSVNDYLDAYLGDNATPYIQPLADIFTSNLNSGVWEWSGMDSSLYLRLRIHTMFSFTPNSLKTFKATTGNNFEPEQVVEVPTIVGKNEAVAVEGLNGTYYIFPTGYNVDVIPLATPQLTLGGLFHTELSARFLSFTLNKDLGDLRFLGLGIRHEISSYFNLPVEVSLGYFFHDVKAGTILHVKEQLLTASIGKSGKRFSGQLLFGYQASKVNADYTYDDGEIREDVHLALTNNNPFMVEANAGLRLGILYINGGIGYSKLLSTSLGMGLSF